MGHERRCRQVQPTRQHSSPLSSNSSSIEENFLFPRWGTTITLTSDYGTTVVAVGAADRFGAKATLVTVPASGLSAAQVKNIVAHASAAQEFTEHLKNIFDTGELDEKAVCRDFRHTAEDGKDYTTAF